MGFLGISNEITLTEYLVMCLVPVEDQQMTSVRMNAIGCEKGRCDFCVSKDCFVIKSESRRLRNGEIQLIVSFYNFGTSAFSSLSLTPNFAPTGPWQTRQLPKAVFLRHCAHSDHWAGRQNLTANRVVRTVFSQQNACYSCGSWPQELGHPSISWKVWAVARRLPGRETDKGSLTEMGHIFHAL